MIKLTLLIENELDNFLIIIKKLYVLISKDDYFLYIIRCKIRVYIHAFLIYLCKSYIFLSFTLVIYKNKNVVTILTFWSYIFDMVFIFEQI